MQARNCEDSWDSASDLWFPFTRGEFEIALALAGLLLAVLTLCGAGADIAVLSLVEFTGASYIAGLCVYARRARHPYRFVENGGLGGFGYLDAVRRARRSLLLQHIDDDAPSAELLGVYRDLLDTGILLRRLVFLRPDARPEGLLWIRDFGNHPNLEQRLVLPEHAELVRWSFAVVDEHEVVVSMPGIAAVDADSYAEGVLFRHVMVLRDAAVARAFVRMHEHVWVRATPLRDVSQLDDLVALRQALEATADVTSFSPHGEEES